MDSPPTVLLHGIAKFLPIFSFCNHQRCSPFSHSVPVSCFRWPLGQSSPKGLLLQLDSFFQLLASPSGSSNYCNSRHGQPWGPSYWKPQPQWRSLTWSIWSPYLQPPLVDEENSSIIPSPDVPSSPSLPGWGYQVCPAVFPSNKPYSSPGGEQLRALPLSIPKCQGHTATGLMTHNYKVKHQHWPKVTWYQIHINHLVLKYGVCNGLSMTGT